MTDMTRAEHPPGSVTYAVPADFAPVKPSTAVDELADHVARLRAITTRIKELQGQADEIKAAIQDAMGEHEIGTVHGLPVVTWSRHIRHTFDQTAFKQNEPGLYGAYLKASPVRRFTIIEENA